MQQIFILIFCPGRDNCILSSLNPDTRGRSVAQRVIYTICNLCKMDAVSCFPPSFIPSHLGLLVILNADLFYQFQLGFQPVHVFLLVFQYIFQKFAADIIPLGLAVRYGLPQ